MSEPVHLSEEVRDFLMTGTFTGKVAHTAHDGRPIVVPVWFVVDGDQIVFQTDADSAKGRAMRTDPRVCLCVDNQIPPYGFVQVQGTVELSEDVEAMLPWATEIAGRYMGADRADEFGHRNAVAGELLVRLTPTKVIAQLDTTS